MSEPAASTNLSATPSAPSPPSDPYIVYQLRKPSQRGTAVIPRFVPNTHAPAFSPANYRFARVWATSESGSNLPANALLHVPRSFEYAGSLGSESSFWSDTSSSWVSVSSLRTAASDVRAPLLHHSAPPVSAAAFFNHDFHPTNHPQHSDFRYPSALSESVSEDALVDDLLSLRSPQFPALRSDSDRSSARPTNHQRHPRPIPDHLAARPPPQQPPHHRSRADAPRLIPPQPTPKAHLLPALTSKRRSLWQWLFCSDGATGSTTAPSLQAPPPKPGLNPAAAKDRVPGGDRDFLHRAKAAPDAKASRRRTPSFEIRRGRPEQAKGLRRSRSWTLVTRALGVRDGKKKKKPQPPSTQPPPKESPKMKRKKHRQKDRARGIVVAEERGSREAHHLRFQRSSSGKEQPPQGRRDGQREREARKSRRTTEAVVRHEQPQDRPREDRPRGDRPREDRPRQTGQGQMNESAPVQKSVVPSLREKKGGSGSVHSQRMRSVESADPVTSRISSDLSSTIERSTFSGASTPVIRQGFSADGHDLDPAANGVSSDVSSHASGGPGKSSPVEQKAPTALIEEPAGFAPPIDFDAINARRESQGTPFRSEEFAYPSLSTTESGVVDPGGAREWESPTAAYPEYPNPSPKLAVDPTPDLSKLTDPVARALEKNRARSAGGPLSYLMRTHETENDVDTLSTGLTSLADESVSTHKTFSGVEEYKAMPGYGGSSRYRYRDPKKTARHFQEIPDDISDTSGPGRLVIFKNSGLFNPAGAMSPSRVSSSASPRRFHSDWSDPHATDIDVYCQCSCSCVYEEECRRTCELVYGRSSPSVSSSRSCSRRGYSGFQTLPPAMDTEMRYRNLSPNLSPNGVESSGEPQAFIGPRGDGGKTGFEARKKSAQKSYMRASEVDELPDPRSAGVGQTTYHAYVSSQTESHMYDAVPRYEYQEESTNPSSQSKRYRTDKHNNDRRRAESREGRTSRSDQRLRTVQEESRGSRPRTHHRDSSRSTRRPGSSPHHRSSSREEGSTHPREQRTRTSSRNTSGSGSSRHSPGLPKVQDVPRNGKKRDFSDEIVVERRRRDADERKKYGQGPHVAGTQQMGNSYVVKRNGLPPFNQAQMPEPYRASGFGREVSYDFEDEQSNSSSMLATRQWPSGTYDTSSPVGHGPLPVVELEFETGHMGSSPDPHRSRANRSADGHRGYGNSPSTGQQHRKGESGNRGSRPGLSSPQSKGSPRPSAKQIKVTSRQSSKSSSRSRTPLLGIF